MHRQAEARRNVAREPAQRGATPAVPGPRHDDLAALSATLNGAPAVQRLAVMAGGFQQGRAARSGAQPIQAKGRGGLVTTPVVQRALGDYWRRMRDGFGSVGAAAGVAAGAIGYGVAGAAMAANPVMWGIGTGLGAAALGSYLMGGAAAPAGGAVAGGGPPIGHVAAPHIAAAPTRFLDMNFGNDDDGEWTPGGAYHARRQAIIAGTEPPTPLEAQARTFDGTYTQYNLGGGQISMRNGRGGQPFVQSRVGDYGGARVAVDYDDVAAVLDEGTARQIEKRAYALLRGALGGVVNFAGWADRQRRAGMHLLGITQLAEEHTTRTEGSALLGRGALQAIADGTMTFTEAFNRENGHYTPAHHGGTREMRQIGAGTRAPHDDLAGLSEGL